MEKVEKKEKGQLLKVQEGSKTKDEMPKKTNKTWEAFGNPKVALSSMTLNSYYKHEVFD